MQSDPVGDADEDSANGKGLVGAHDEALQDPRLLTALIGTAKDKKALFEILNLPSFGQGSGSHQGTGGGWGGGGGGGRPWVPWSVLRK